MKTESAELTMCEVGREGRAIMLGFIDSAGRPASLVLPFDQAQALAMTLPRLLTAALRAMTRSPEMRYVFPLGDWQLSLQRTSVNSFSHRRRRTVSRFRSVSRAQMLRRGQGPR